MKNNKSVITDTMQKVAADILAEFAFCKTLNEMNAAWEKVFRRYNLYLDPFTNMPCTTKDYFDNLLKKEKQMMIERYRHCDGLE